VSTELPEPAGLNGVLSRWVKTFRLAQARRELPGARAVLDLGSGLCEITPDVPPSARYVGVERDRWMYERAVRLFPAREFLRADIEEEGFDPGGRFDLLLLVAVWEHLREPEAFLRRAAGWTEPGGKLLLTTPSPLAHRLLDAGARLGLLSSMAAEEHDRLWRIGEIAALASKHGWRVERRGRFLMGLNQVMVLRREG
jgi:SAM-dependent methyltransferase